MVSASFWWFVWALKESNTPASIFCMFICSNLVKIMHWVAESNPTERQVHGIAKSMFRKMAQGRKVIPKSEIEESSQRLCSSSITPRSIGSEGSSDKSMNELRSSVKRLLHSAVLLSGLNEVSWLCT